METIDLRLDGNLGMTLLSNAFIDNYMKHANDAELKVYLYLLRSLSAGRPVDIPSLADTFNYSEKDILRALLYWERMGVLQLVYDTAERAVGDDYGTRTEQLSGILLSPLLDGAPARIHPFAQRVSSALPLGETGTPESTDTPRTPEPAAPFADSVLPQPTAPFAYSALPQPAAPKAAASASREDRSPAASPEDVKAGYTLDDLRAFRADPSCGFLFTAAQQYLGRPLTQPQLRTLLYLTRELRFAPELTDYLLQYCIGGGNRSFHYIEGTALAWAEQGITSPEEARSATRTPEDSKEIAHIMEQLGRCGTPAPQELRLIRRWLHSYALPMAVIDEACARTVLAVENHRFAYAESILAKWHESGVRELGDIAALDEAYRRSRESAAAPGSTAREHRRGTRPSKFNSFEQRDFDYDSIEQLLTGGSQKTL